MVCFMLRSAHGSGKVETTKQKGMGSWLGIALDVT